MDIQTEARARSQAVSCGFTALVSLWVGIGLTFIPAVRPILPVAFVVIGFAAIGLGVIAAGRAE